MGGRLSSWLRTCREGGGAFKVTYQKQEKRWNLVALRGTVGDSDIQGDVSLELSGERPTVVADLKSKTLDLDDLGVLVGAPPGTGPGETASREQKQKAAQEAAAKAPVLPDKQFDVPGLHGFDARISFSGDTVQAMKLPLEHMEAKVTLQDGHIKIDPARLDVAGGKLETRVGLSAPSGVLNGDLFGEGRRHGDRNVELVPLREWDGGGEGTAADRVANMGLLFFSVFPYQKKKLGRSLGKSAAKIG